MNGAFLEGKEWVRAGSRAGGAGGTGAGGEAGALGTPPAYSQERGLA